MAVGDIEAATSHKEIVEFSEIVAVDLIDDVVAFEKLQEQRYMKFWKNFCLTQLDDDEKNFEIILWGTELVRKFNKELTGKRGTAESFGDEFSILAKNSLVALRDKQVAYLSGEYSWKNSGDVNGQISGLYGRHDEEELIWWQVCVPVLRSGKLCCLSLVYFE